MDGQDGRPFDDIRRLLATMPPIGRPAGPDDIVAWVARCQGKPRARIARGLVCLFASTHGASVAREREPGLTVAATRARLDLFGAGGALANAVCAEFGLGLKAFDLALDLPTGDVAAAPAMDERSCVATMAFGMEAVAGGADLVVIGHGSRGTDVLAAACLSALWGDPAEAWLDPGAPDGPEASALVASALARHRADRGGDDPLAILASLGGRDLAALAGAIVAARHETVPVLLDGFAALAVAALLGAVEPTITEGCRPAAAAPHARHGALVRRLGADPVLDGAVARGSEVGAVLAAGLLKALVTAATASPARPLP